MASKNTNSTILTLAVVAVAVFAAWKVIPALLKKLNAQGASASPIASGGGISNDGDIGSGYTGQYPGQDNSILSMLQNLLKGGSGSGSGGSGAGTGGTSKASSTDNSGAPDPYAGFSNGALDSLFGLNTDGTPISSNFSTTTPDLGGVSIPYQSLGDQSAGINIQSLPTAPGAMISSLNDGSSQDVAAAAGISNYGNLDTTSEDFGNYSIPSEDVASYDTGSSPFDNSGGDGSDTTMSDNGGGGDGFSSDGSGGDDYGD
jgi:hypothetical protein